MTANLAIYHPVGRLVLGQNPFGKDVANRDLFRALAIHGDIEQLAVLTARPVAPADILNDLGAPPGLAVTNHGLLDQAAAASAGALFRGTPHIQDLAWLRRGSVGARAYSLIGLVHTIAPPALRQDIAMASLAPVRPWDALICTSPSVQQALIDMFDNWDDYLADRFGGRKADKPQLPLIPLGVDQPGLQAQADRPQVRTEIREELGLAPDDVLVLWVGRLSFFEKAFPQPMFRAVEEAMAASGVRVHFAMAGWFPNGDRDRGHYEASAKAYAPSIPIHFLDGNDKDLIGRLWAGSDIFLSLVDNIQETFGITPLEAMACGLPVVVSDWDGYRYTVRDGQEGFLIPTLGGAPDGVGRAISLQHAFQFTSYQDYVGTVAQHTAVNVGQAAQALSRLVTSPDLRRTMGMAGRARVREMFDWPVVVKQIRGLARELEAIRSAGQDPEPRHRRNPVKGDPFRDFAHFATEVIGVDTRLRRRPGIADGDLARTADIALDRYAQGWRGTPQEDAQVFALLGPDVVLTVKDILLSFPQPRRRSIEMGLVWMCKLGLLDWID